MIARSRLPRGNGWPAGIDGATLTVLPGRTHIPFAGDTQSLLNAMRRGLGLPPRDRATTPTLTPRQHQVAGMVARGWSNRQIAEELVVSERTAESHVERIRDRLGFRSRAQVAAWYVASPQATDLRSAVFPLLTAPVPAGRLVACPLHQRPSITATASGIPARRELEPAEFPEHPARGRFNSAFFWVMGGYINWHMRQRKSTTFAGLPPTVVELGAGVGANMRYLPARRAPDRDRTQPVHAHPAAACGPLTRHRSRDPQRRR